jgi:hypothetical protein
MKKTVIAIAAVAMLAIMIPFTFADVVLPPCHCAPGRTPGYWKHQLKVYLGETNGKYSWYFGDTKMSDDYMELILAAAGNTAEFALSRLEAKGPGSAEIRYYQANLLNMAANLDTGVIV